jgi:hypothetical protein
MNVSIKVFGALDTNRTCDPPLRRGMLYPLSYEGTALKALFYNGFEN